MNASAPSDVHMVAAQDMPSECGVATHNERISDLTVVRDMAVGEDRIAVSDSCELTLLGRDMDGRVFAEYIIVPDGQSGLPAGVLQVVGFAANQRIGEDFVSPANFRISFDRGVVMNSALGAKANVRTNVGIRSNFNRAG